MGLAGAGFGASKALEEILGEQMLRAQMAQRQKEAAASIALQQQRANQDAIEGNARINQGQQQIDLAAGDRRERSNITGVRRMISDSLMQGGTPDRKALAAMQIEAGDAPTMLNEPTPVRDPIKDYEAKAAIDARHRPPQRPERDPIADHEAKLRLDQKYKTGQATGPTPYAQERATRTLQSVDELMGKVSRWTTGYGSLLANMPETDARSFDAELNTLKANIAFNELTAMREASKTGGALGQVSNIELKLLESALGALDTGMRAEDFKAQLQKIKDSIERWQAAGGKPSMAPVTSRDGDAPAATGGGGAPRPKLRFDAKGNPKP